MTDYMKSFHIGTTGITYSLIAFSNPFLFGWLFPIGLQLTNLANYSQRKNNNN